MLENETFITFLIHNVVKPAIIKIFINWNGHHKVHLPRNAMKSKFKVQIEYTRASNSGTRVELLKLLIRGFYVVITTNKCYNEEYGAKNP